MAFNNMDIFNNILISIDFKSDSEQAKIDRVIELARQNENTALTLMYVAPEVPADPEMSIVSCKNQQQSLVKHAQERLDTLTDSFHHEAQFNNKVTCLVRVGKPSVVLTQQVLKGQHDLLLVNTQQKTLKESLFGNATMDVIRACPCPIWAVKPKPTEREKIMIGIDFDLSREDRNAALNHELLRVADMFRAPSTTEIHLVNILDKVTDELREQNTNELNHLSEQILNPAFKIVVNVVEGDAKKILPDYARQESIALLVVGTRATTGLKRFFIGSTVEKVLETIDCSVLTVKPQSFVSPIGLT